MKDSRENKIALSFSLTFLCFKNGKFTSSKNHRGTLSEWRLVYRSLFKQKVDSIFRAENKLSKFTFY